MVLVEYRTLLPLEIYGVICASITEKCFPRRHLISARVTSLSVKLEADKSNQNALI